MNFLNIKSKQIYNFEKYLKSRSFFVFLNKNKHNNVKKPTIWKLFYLHLNGSLSYYFLKKKNLYNYINYMFMIKSNQKQYFLSFLGFNVFFFNTVSTGKLLKKKKLLTKSLKSSIKSNKYLLHHFGEFYNNPNNFISYYYLKPINRKNINFFYLLLKTFKVNLAFLGFKNYYKTSTKSVRRIKKRVKKKLLNNHAYYN